MTFSPRVSFPRIDALFRGITLLIAGGFVCLDGLLSAAEPDPATAPAPLAREQLDFFETKIRPLLADRCYECHSATAKKLKANLRLDTRKGIRDGGDLGPAIVPGHPEKSLLIEAVEQHDKDLAMPPKSRLADHEIKALRDWIQMGAPDPRTHDAPLAGTNRNDAIARRHWAYQPIPREVIAPPVSDPAWSHNPIDQFIFARLVEKNLRPVAAADKRALFRRASFDLHGLPPTPDEMNAFLADTSADAWPNAIDRFLASPRYGERWGRHWMDIVR
jgi:hypothetical protein